MGAQRGDYTQVGDGVERALVCSPHQSRSGAYQIYLHPLAYPFLWNHQFPFLPRQLNRPTLYANGHVSDAVRRSLIRLERSSRSSPRVSVCPAHAVRYSVRERPDEGRPTKRRKRCVNKTRRSHDAGSRTFSAEEISMRQTRYLELSSSTICHARRSGASKSSSTTSPFTAPPFQTSKIRWRR